MGWPGDGPANKELFLTSLLHKKGAGAYPEKKGDKEAEKSRQEPNRLKKIQKHLGT